MSEKVRIITTENVDFEYRQMIEDDALMHEITPSEKIKERLSQLFGESLVEKWEKEKDQ